MLPSSIEIIEILEAPLTPIDLRAAYEFETIELDGNYVLVDVEAAERVGAMLALAIVPPDRNIIAAIPLLIDTLAQDRTSSLPLRGLVASCSGARVAKRAQLKVDTLVFLIEADLACQTSARLALAALGAPAVAALIVALGSPSANRRAGAAAALGLMGAAATRAVPMLQRVWGEDPSEGVRASAAEALARLASSRKTPPARHRAAS
jgi:HEAT repeat protein